MKWQPYPGYKPSRVEWLGEVPNSWPVTRLRFRAKINPSKAEINGVSGDTMVSFVPMEAVGEYGGLRLDQAKLLDEVANGYTYFREGDVVVAKITPCFENWKGSVAQGLENGLGFGTTELHVIRPADDLDRRYLFYLTITHAFRSVGASYMYGAGGQKRVPDDFIRNFRHPFPPSDEQRSIAAFLDRETGRIDRLMEKKQRQIELLQEKRTALISHAVTKGLDPSASLKDSGIPWLTGVPQEWEVAPLGRVAPLQRGHDLPSEVRKSGNIPVVSSAGIVDYHSIPKAKGPGVITGRYGTIGEVFYVDNDYWPLNTTLYVYDFRENHPRYIYYLILILPFSAHSDKSAVPGVNRNHLHPLLVLKPPIEDQKAIADFLDQETAKIDVLIAKVQESIDRLKEYRTALISAAVTGEIDVRGEVRKAPAAFPRIVLAAEIVDRLHDDPNFGRVKFQKTLYLCEHHLGMDLEGNYWRQAAGPLDNRMLYSLENRIQRQKWFATCRDGQKFTYVPMEKAGGHRKYLDDYWAAYREGLDSLLELMRPLNTEQSEIVATLFAAWNDLIIAGLPFTDEDILYEVRSNWHESKERFDEDRLRKALQWMRDKGLIPQGLGKPTRK